MEHIRDLSIGSNIFPYFDKHRQKSTSTTAVPITTTLNSFWSDWSATQPNSLKGVEKVEHSHSAALIVSDSTTLKDVDGLLPWMKDVLNDYSTTPKRSDHFQRITERSVQTTTEPMPSWLQTVLNQHSTSATTTPVQMTTTTELPNWLKDVLDRQTSSTTTEIPNWLYDVLNRHTTTKTSNVFNDFSNVHETTTQSWNNDFYSVTPNVVKNATEPMPIWMQGILNEYSTTTTPTSLPFLQIHSTTEKSNSGDGLMSNPSNGGGGGGFEFTDLTDSDRYSK